MYHQWIVGGILVSMEIFMKPSESVTDSVSSIDTSSTCLWSFPVSLNIDSVVSL